MVGHKSTEIGGNMSAAEFKNAPPLYGWILAKAAGIVAFGISYLVMDMEFMGAAFVAVAIALAVGVIFTLADGGPVARPAASAVHVPAPVAAVEAPVVEAIPVAAPVSAPAEPDPVEIAQAQPQKLDGPVGVADDLKQINGVGPVLEGKLNGLGIYHFWQIARWTDAEVAWVDGFLNFKGRIGRDNWITQAIKLAETSPAKPPR
jgi:predicted flap endonuclease-1-like 5' DNA nuclease